MEHDLSAGEPSLVLARRLRTRGAHFPLPRAAGSARSRLSWSRARSSRAACEHGFGGSRAPAGREAAEDARLGAGRERGTWQAYGGAESDFRPERWKGFREDYGFTGKEEDVEVGLQYFGKRYYAPLLNRWVSADPLAVHVPGEADLNVYGYVKGHALRAVDPLGLDYQFKIKGHEITVVMDFTIGGKGSSAKLAKQMEAKINAVWGQKTWQATVDGKKYSLKIETRVRAVSEKEFVAGVRAERQSRSGRNFVSVAEFPSERQAQYRALGSELLGRRDHAVPYFGQIPKSQVSSIVSPHEAGHFLGLHHDEKVPQGFIMREYVEHAGPKVSRRDVDQIAGLVVKGTAKAREARGEASEVAGFVKAFTNLPSTTNRLIVPPAGETKPAESGQQGEPKTRSK